MSSRFIFKQQSASVEELSADFPRGNLTFFFSTDGRYALLL